MIIRYTLIGPRARCASSGFQLQRRQGPADLLARPRRARAAPSMPPQQAAVVVVARPAARSWRGRSRAGCGSPRACRRRGRSSSLPSRSQTPSSLGRVELDVEDVAVLGAGAPAAEPPHRPPRRRRRSAAPPVTARPSSASLASSASACGTVRGKPSRMKPSAASLGVDPLGDHADDHLVGDQVAAVHVLLRGPAQLRLVAHRRPQDVPGRVIGQPQVFLQPLPLRALPAAGRA